MGGARIRSSLQGCAIAVVGTAAIVLFWLTLPGAWGEHVPFSLLLFAVAGAAIVGGIWPGMLAVVLGTMASIYFGQPRFTWALHERGEQLLLVVFLLTGPFMALLCARLRHALSALRAERAALLRANVEIERRARDQSSELERQVSGRTRELAALVAERSELVESERVARGEAERALRLRDEFVANVSHELRTPLNAMLGWAGLIRGGKLDTAATTKAIEVIERNARVQAALVEDLLDLSRIGSGKIRLEVQSVNLGKVVEDALLSQEPAACAKGVQLRRVIEEGACMVRGDPARLEQIAANLIANAVKFTPRGGSVIVTCRRRESRTELVVHDTGQGIHADFLPLLFDRFRQAETGKARRHGGLGLGLTLVKFLVEQHGGVVRVESEGEGKGATFTVTLPITAVDEAGAGLTPIDAAAALAGIKALVVDDEPDARLLVRRLLEDCKVEVTVAASGAEALDQLPRLRPDVLISDIGMPELDGYGLLRAVRALAPDRGGVTPAVALTAFARPADRDCALEAGYQAHLAKPVDPSALVLAVAGAVGRAKPPAPREAREP